MNLRAVGALGAAVALGLLTACGSEQSGAGQAPDRPAEPDLPIVDTHWTVSSITVDGKKTDTPSTKAHVSFDKKKGEVSGNFGCNGFGGVVKIEGDTLTVDNIAKTQMSCGEEIDKLENALTDALEGELKAKVTGDGLTLTTAKGDVITLTAEQSAELVGTKWSLTAAVDKEVATALPKTAKDPHLIFGKDGSVRGNLGCNQLTAKAEILDDDTIKLGPAGLTRKVCPDKDVMKAEQQLAKLFDSTVQYEIQHRTLQLTGKDGLGLNATAAEQKG